MKEASGELSMSLITIIAVGIILTIFIAFYPQIRDAINNRWGTFEEAGNQAQQNILNP